MKSLFSIILIISSFTAFSKTYFIDPLANLVYYDVSKDRTSRLFETNPYNQELINLIKTEKDIFIFNEFSGLGELNLSTLPQAQYFAPPRSYLEPLILKFNEWGFVKTDDFFMNLDSILFSFFTWHPFSKRNAINRILNRMDPSEEIVVITTTWKSGEALYKSLLKNRTKVSYIVRDLNLNKTLFRKNEVYSLVPSEENTHYVIFDSGRCVEAFNLNTQAQLISSSETFTKTKKYREGNKREIKMVERKIAEYKEVVCGD